MMRTASPRPIVVGIDGSDAAVRAARWAVDEASGRGLSLRFVHVIEPGSEAVRLEDEYAELALRDACAAVEAVDRSVPVEAVIRRGGISSVLVEESRDAEMICVGSAVGDADDDRDGEAVSAALARAARCPLAVIMDDERVAPEGGYVAVVVDDADVSGSTMRDAFLRARLGRASLLVLRLQGLTLQPGCDPAFEARLRGWQAEYPEVDVHCAAVTIGSDAGWFLDRIVRPMASTIIDGTQLGVAADFIDRGDRGDRVGELPRSRATLQRRPDGWGVDDLACTGRSNGLASRGAATGTTAQ